MTPRRTGARFQKICIALGCRMFPAFLNKPGARPRRAKNFSGVPPWIIWRDPAQGAQAIGQFLEAYPICTILATCRRHQNHGMFNGSIEEQLAVLKLATENGARAIDVEIETAEVAPDALRGSSNQHTTGGLLASFRDHASARSGAQAHAEGPRGCAPLLVSTARKPTDTGRILAASRLRPENSTGDPRDGRTRFPFLSSLDRMRSRGVLMRRPRMRKARTAGQVNARQLRSLYPIDKFTKAAKIYAVIVDPVRQSVSPHAHNRAFQSRRIDAVYVPLLVSANQLRDFFQLATDLPLSGFSVTIPHKRRIMRYLGLCVIRWPSASGR